MNRIYLHKKEILFVEAMLKGKNFLACKLHCEACNTSFIIEVNWSIVHAFSFCPFCGVISEIQKGEK